MKLAVCCLHSFFLVFSALILALIVYNSVWLDITVFFTGPFESRYLPCFTVDHI